jgi:ABC-type dipeptide/oligopeptide/nickel transport system ATPase component
MSYLNPIFSIGSQMADIIRAHDRAVGKLMARARDGPSASTVPLGPQSDNVTQLAAGRRMA